MVDGQHAVWAIASDDSKRAAGCFVRAPMDDVLDLPAVAVEGICQASQALTGRIGHADVQNLGGGKSTLCHELWPPQHTVCVSLPLPLPKDV